MRLPGGRQAQSGVAIGQSHLVRRLGYAETSNDERVIDPQLCRGWFAAAVRGKAKTPRRGEEFSSLRAAIAAAIALRSGFHRLLCTRPPSL